MTTATIRCPACGAHDTHCTITGDWLAYRCGGREQIMPVRSTLAQAALSTAA